MSIITTVAVQAMARGFIYKCGILIMLQEIKRHIKWFKCNKNHKKWQLTVWAGIGVSTLPFKSLHSKVSNAHMAEFMW